MARVKMRDPYTGEEVEVGPPPTGDTGPDHYERTTPGVLCGKRSWTPFLVVMPDGGVAMVAADREALAHVPDVRLADHLVMYQNLARGVHTVPCPTCERFGTLVGVAQHDASHVLLVECPTHGRVEAERPGPIPDALLTPARRIPFRTRKSRAG